MSRKSQSQTKQEQQKEAIRLEHRLNHLYKAQRELGTVKLEVPIRHGWERSYRLRAQESKSAEAPIYNRILAIIGTKEKSNRKDFLTKSYLTKKLIPLEQNLKKLEPKEYDLLDKELKSYFTYVKIVRKNYRKEIEIVYKWEFKFPYVFEFVIKPYYITELKLFDSEIEREITYIKYKLYDEMFWTYLPSAAHSKDDYRRKKVKILRRPIKIEEE